MDQRVRAGQQGPQAAIQCGGAILQLACTVVQIKSAVFQLLCAVIQIFGAVVQFLGAIVQFVCAVVQFVCAVVQFLCAVIQLMRTVVQLDGAVLQFVKAVAHFVQRFVQRGKILVLFQQLLGAGRGGHDDGGKHKAVGVGFNAHTVQQLVAQVGKIAREQPLKAFLQSGQGHKGCDLGL